jgi:16S rRNA (cytidine1402-2'-O)-methyltransferase
MTSELVFLTVPIGNLSDISQRVMHALTHGRKFIVEDTRVFLSLLNALKIDTNNKEIATWHDHSDENSLKKIKNWIRLKENIYILSDAGSPVLSDPAYDLLQKLGEENYTLDSYGGVTSVMQALELSKLPPIPFHFHGFLARNDQDIKQQISNVMNTKGTHIYFVSPHRVVETIDTLSTILPMNTSMVLARELTKKFQEVLRFTTDQWIELKKDLTVKGEFVALFYIPMDLHNNFQKEKLVTLTNEYFQNPKPKNLAKVFSEISGESVSEVYKKIHTSKE